MSTSAMREADIAEVSEVLCACYEELGRREGLTRQQIDYLKTQRGSVECVRRESGCQRYLVSRSGGRIAGVVAVSGDTIAKLYVRPTLTGRGIGRELFTAAEELIGQGGHRSVWLGAFPTAVGFYEAMGLRVVGEKPATGPLRGRDVVLMEKELDDRGVT